MAGHLLATIMYRTASILQPYLFPSPKIAPAATLKAPHNPGSGRNPQQAPAVSFPLLVYAHRGGCLEEGRPVENTLPAFRVANKLGVDVLELDVQLTRDGHVVVCHDRDLGRLCGPQHAGKRVADYALAELPQLRYDYQPLAFTDQHRSQHQTSGNGDAEYHAGSQQGANSGANSSSSNRDAGAADPDRHRIPLFQDILREFPNTPLQVDLKVDTPGLVPAVVRLLAQQQQAEGRRQRMLWGSFIHKVQCEAYAADPSIPLFTSAPRALYLRIAYAAGAMHKVHIYESVIIVPWRMRLPWPWSLWRPRTTARSTDIGAAGGRSDDSGSGGISENTNSVQHASTSTSIHSQAANGKSGDNRTAGVHASSTVHDSVAAPAPSSNGLHSNGQRGAVHGAAGSMHSTPQHSTPEHSTGEQLESRSRAGDAFWYPFLDRGWIRALQQRGVSVVMFGPDLNNEAAYEAVLAAGADAVCTDHPSRLQAYLKTRGNAAAAAAATAARATDGREPAAQLSEQSSPHGPGNGATTGHSSSCNKKQL